ncbi:MAG TPA: hypothetical protein VIC84_24705 [Blastocatellia bacterium]
MKDLAPVSEPTPEEESLLETASAPTLRDLREEAKDLFMHIESEPDSTSEPLR